MSWTKREIETLKRLHSKDTLFFTEISEKMGMPAQRVRWMARKLGLKKPAGHRMSKWNCKHAHLREPAMTYFLDHTFDETRDRFGLTRSEMKSLMTVSYRRPELAHLRKDTRRHDPWTLDEMLFLLRHSGIRERGWIAKKINRSTARNIKERMRSWNAATKHLNGMPVSWARQFWPEDPLSKRIRTKAGPSGGLGIWRFQIIPWHECLKLSLKYPTPVEIRAGIRAMVRFQQFIHGSNSALRIHRGIEKMVRAR